MFEALFRQFFGGMSGNSTYESNCALQETARKQILLTELDSEIQKLIEHYHITEEKRGQSGTTTLSEIGTVVYRARRRADAYSKVLNELYLRTGYRLEIINSKKAKNADDNGKD